MKTSTSLLASIAVLAAAPTVVTATTIDFEGVTSFASVADYYNGGADSAGAAGGDVGVAFSGAALALSNDALGPYFSNAPTPGTVMFASDSTALMNVAAGFAGEVSFWYSASAPALDVVQIYSGLDGGGSLLGQISLSQNAQLGCSGSAYCNWQRISLGFSGIGRSVGFGGNVGNVAFDNITVTPVPEPATALLLAAGGVLVAARRRGKVQPKRSDG